MDNKRDYTIIFSDNYSADEIVYEITTGLSLEDAVEEAKQQLIDHYYFIEVKEGLEL